MAPFPTSSVVDKRQVAICLRLKGETANDEFADDLRLRDIQLVIAQVCYFGIVHQEGYIDASNVMLLHDGKATRVGFKMDGDKKVRFAKSTGKVID